MIDYKTLDENTKGALLTLISAVKVATRRGAFELEESSHIANAVYLLSEKKEEELPVIQTGKSEKD